MARTPGVYEGEPEIDAGRRAFPEAQRLLAAPVLHRVSGRLPVSWHGTEIDAETGAFAVVRLGASSAVLDLVGETLLVTTLRTRRSAHVYVLGARDVPADLSLTRRTFLALGLLAAESLACSVHVTA